MESTTLQQVADLLDTLASGQWLQQQLVEYLSPSLQPHILVLLSAPAKHVFPDGSQLDPSWHIWPEGSELTLPVLEQADLILWLMPALRLFPGEYHLALEEARQQSIPVWAIVTGIERLSDENSFLHQRLPKQRASLPDGSQFFLVRPKMRTPLRETISQALDREGVHMWQQGENRRLNILTSRLQEQLNQERQAVSQHLNMAERSANTARAGIASLKILMSAAPTAILTEYSALVKTVEILKNQLLGKADVEGVHAPLDELTGVFTSAVDTWQQDIFETALREKYLLAQTYAQQWYEEYTQEIAAYFRFSHSLDTAKPPENPPFPAEQFNMYLNTLQKAIQKSFDRFFSSFRYSVQHVASATETGHEMRESPRSEDFSEEEREHYTSHSSYQADESSTRNVTIRQRIDRLVERGRRAFNELNDPTYNYEEQRREICYELIHRHIEWFTEDLLLTIQQQKKPLVLLLEDVHSASGNQRLEHIQSTLTTPREQLALIAEAERLLRRRV